MVPSASPRRQVAAFLALLVAVRGPFYAVALAGGWGPHDRNVPLAVVAFAMLSAPPALAVAARVLTTRRLRGALRGFGWHPGPVRYLLAGWAAPVLVALAVYGAAWAAGLIAPAPGRAPALAPLAGRALVMTLGLLVPTLLFEELGWRGLLVPQLARFLPFGRVAFASGAVWALFHYPFLLSPAYATVPPTAGTVAAFTAAVVAASYPMAWLRLRSGSVWPAVLFHAAHNMLAAGGLAHAFRSTGPLGAAVLAESGAGLALGYVPLAWWAWRHRAALPDVAMAERAAPGSARPDRGRRARAWRGDARRAAARALRGLGPPSVPRLLGAVLLVLGVGHLAYGLAQRAAAVSVAGYAVLAACGAAGAWLVRRPGAAVR